MHYRRAAPRPNGPQRGRDGFPRSAWEPEQMVPRDDLGGGEGGSYLAAAVEADGGFADGLGD